MPTTPTGEILKFIDDFNKEFDKSLENDKKELEDLKIVYNQMIAITAPKTTDWPGVEKIQEGNSISWKLTKKEEVKTIGDLIKYVYNIEKSLYTPFRTTYDMIRYNTEIGEAYKAYLQDLDGKTLPTPDPDFEKKIQKIEKAMQLKTSIEWRTELKKPQGPNPSLWSPGQYYFDNVMEVTRKIIKDAPTRTEIQEDVFEWSYPYQADLRNGKEVFTYSISNFTKDGDVRIDDSRFKGKKDKEDVNYDPRDGQAGFLVFRNMLEFEKNFLDNAVDAIGIVDKNYSASTYKNLASRYPSLKTQYLSGSWKTLQENPIFDYNRGNEYEKRGGGPPEDDVFVGHFELLGLYKAFIQAGDNYEPPTLPRVPEKKPEPKTEQPTNASTSAASTSSTSGTDGSAGTSAEKIYTFNVEDENTFFCKDPIMELTIIKPTNDIEQVITTEYRQEAFFDEEEILAEEYRELDELIDDPGFNPNQAEIDNLGQNNQNDGSGSNGVVEQQTNNTTNNNQGTSLGTSLGTSQGTSTTDSTSNSTSNNNNSTSNNSNLTADSAYYLTSNPDANALVDLGQRFGLFFKNLGGARLGKIPGDLAAYLTKNGWKSTLTGAVMRPFYEATFDPPQPLRAFASWHAVGLAIDLNWKVIPEGETDPIPWEKISQNKNLAAYPKLNELIQKWVDSQGDITWGYNFNGAGSCVAEYHHFEISDSKKLDYWKGLESAVAKYGFDVKDFKSNGYAKGSKKSDPVRKYSKFGQFLLAVAKDFPYKIVGKDDIFEGGNNFGEPWYNFQINPHFNIKPKGKIPEGTANQNTAPNKRLGEVYQLLDSTGQPLADKEVGKAILTGKYKDQPVKAPKEWIEYKNSNGNIGDKIFRENRTWSGKGTDYVNKEYKALPPA